MRGRKPKPIATRRREGNAGKRKLPGELALRDPASHGLSPPADLPAEALELWNEVVPTLLQSGILHAIDRAALSALCIQWARGVQARRVLNAEGAFAFGSMAQLVEHPAVALERQAHAMFLRFAEQYALTAAARARISAVLTGAGGSDDALDAILNQPPEEL